MGDHRIQTQKSGVRKRYEENISRNKSDRAEDGIDESRLVFAKEENGRELAGVGVSTN